MAGTEVLTGKLTEVAQNVENFIARYVTSVNRISEIGVEIDAMWDGAAADKFTATITADRERFDALTKLLTAYVEALRTDAGIYGKAEDDVLNVLNTNKIR